MAKVLVVATSKKTRGGITSVIKAHETGEQWEKYHCVWVETHIDRCLVVKLLILIKGLVKYIMLLPGSDLVHIHLSEKTTIKRKLLFYTMAKLYRKKIIIHFHAFSSETTINGTCSKLYRKVFMGADVVVVLSNYWKEQVNRAFNIGDKIRVVYNPCPSIELNENYSKTNSILFAGTLNQRKGYADLMKAFAHVAAKHPDWRLVLAGNGEVENARNLSKALCIEAQVDLLGWVAGSAKEKVYKQASVFCLPSYAEGFPMAVLDAWAYGLPVITTPVGGIPDVAIDGENMLLFNPGDIKALENKLEMIISDKALRDKMCAESLKLAKGKFSLETVTKQVGEIYEKLLK